MRIGLMMSMPGDPTLTAGLVARAVEAERSGFRSAWLPQVFGVDALTVLALAGRETSTLELGTAVVPTYPRHPSVVAMQALTAQDAAGGRLALGLGLSHRVLIEDVLGLDYSRPVAHAREYLAVLNGLLAGENRAVQGRTLPGGGTGLVEWRAETSGAVRGPRAGDAEALREGDRRDDHLDGRDEVHS